MATDMRPCAQHGECASTSSDMDGHAAWWAEYDRDPKWGRCTYPPCDGSGTDAGLCTGHYARKHPARTVRRG